MSNRSIILFACSLVLVSCGSSSKDQLAPQAMERSETSVTGNVEDGSVASPPMEIPLVDRKIIRTGELRFEVGDLDAARNAMLDKVKASGGYVEGDDRSDRGSALAMTLRVRIPAGNFDGFVAGLMDLGELESQSIHAQDVTAQWVDVEARLSAKKKVEARFLEIVEQAKTVTEVLEVERELGNVRAEIESMEAQMRTLHDQVGLSTLTVTCIKPQADRGTTIPHAGVALREGWNYLLIFLVGLLNIWPFLLIGGGVVFWLLRRERRRQQRKSK